MSQPMPVFATAGERETECVCPNCSERVALESPIAVCTQCGTVHHRPCWEKTAGCSSYHCAPARRDLASQPAALKITNGELDNAVPLPARRPIFNGSMPPPISRPPQRRTNGWAIAAFVTALASVIPALGILTGLAAIVLGAVGLGSVRSSGQRGTVLSLIGMLLGLGLLVGQVLLIIWFFFRSQHGLMQQDLVADPTAIDKVEPVLKRAMCASVVLEVGHGFLGSAAGSGVILRIADGEAILVTNRHVVDPKFDGSGDEGSALDGLPDVTVRFVDQTEGKGKVIWLAPDGVDLALVRVPGPSLKAQTALWEPNRALKLADQVFAIGNPHRLGWTRTDGTVSQLWLQSVKGGRKIHVIQTQTAFNPGNSGGGLFDKDGYLVGIPTWTNDKRFSEGINFAISIETLTELRPPELPLPVAKEKMK